MEKEVENSIIAAALFFGIVRLFFFVKGLVKNIISFEPLKKFFREALNLKMFLFNIIL